jgi:hypothetical protein
VRSDTTNVLNLYLQTAAEHGTSPWYTNAYGGTLWSNLVGSWNFEAYYPSKGCVQDESTNMIFGTNGTGAGAAAFLTDYTNGFTNGFVQTDGGDSIDFGDIDAADGCSSLTVSVWWKPIAMGGGVASYGDAIVTKADAVDGWALQIGSAIPVSSNFVWTINSTNSADSLLLRCRDNFLSASNWWNITAVYDMMGSTTAQNANAMGRVYVNGTQFTNWYSPVIDATMRGKLSSTNSSRLLVFDGGSGGKVSAGNAEDEVKFWRNLAFDQLMSTNLFNDTKQKFGYAP